MKNRCLLTGLGALAIVAALLTGCSSSSSGGGDDTDYLAQFVGTWKSTTNYVYSTTNTETDTDTLVINANGTYSWIIVSFHDNPGTTNDYYDSDANTGTVSATADTITFKDLMSYSLSTNMTSIPASGGTEESLTTTDHYLMKDGKFFIDVYTRQGSGTGIIGTWLQTSSESETDTGETTIKDTTKTMSITDTTITNDEVTKTYLKGHSDYSDTAEDTDEYTYTVKDSATITVTRSGETKTKDWPYEIAGDKLILTTGAYTKQ